MTPSNANTSGLDCVRIIACHLPEAHCPDTVCLPITITAGDLRAVYAVLVTAAEARADRYYDALVQADLTVRTFPGTDQSDVDFIRAALQQEG